MIPFFDNIKRNELLTFLFPIAVKTTSLPDVTQIKDGSIVVVSDKSDPNSKAVYIFVDGIPVLLNTTAGSVQTVFGRTGKVIAKAGDYSASLITQDSTHRFVTDTQISAWNSGGGTIKLRTGSQAVTQNTLTIIPFGITFTSVPIVSCMFYGDDGSSSAINARNLTITVSSFTIPASEISLQNGQVWWSAQIN